MTRQASSPPPDPSGSTPNSQQNQTPSPWRHVLLLISLGLFLWLLFTLPLTNTPAPVNLTYTQFIHDVSAHQVSTLKISSDGAATGTLHNGRTYTTVIPVELNDPNLVSELQAGGVQITANSPGPSLGTQIADWILLILVFFAPLALWYYVSKKGGMGLGASLGVGKSNAKVFDSSRPTTTFADVAGYDESKREIFEVVSFLKDPERYSQAGAVAPKGVLMVGPPGTGKTLMARAVAGEAGVTFLSVTGSDFVEMFVGVGAARVRDLFDQARKAAPSIIFIDEIDGIGKRRGGEAVSNDEQEQTLNQLLSEMDGFDMSVGIVVLGATNRPEALDPALLRPGRFDRQVTIPLPNQQERLAILQVHCRNKHLGPDVDLEVVARGTPGFSGADLANLCNEAAIAAVRDGRVVLAASDFDRARDRVILGQREGSNVLLPDEKHSVAVHESGHALVAAHCEHADPVSKVTILPSGQALGVTEQLPIDDRHLYGEDYMKDSLAVRMGGRAAELVELGQGSTGASNDLQSATELATRMVREFGLSAKLGPISYQEGGSVYLGGGGSALSSRPYSEQTQATIDAEVEALCKEAERRAIDILTEHRDQLQQLAALLIDKETVDGSVVYQIAGTPVPTDAAPRAGLVPELAFSPAANGTQPAPSPAKSGGSDPTR
jgi:cell division protease FtsH